MEKHPCLNVTMDDPKVSSPMPVIGLYIAAASLVCFLFMLCDVVHGLHRRKPWQPSRFFSLNSLTLTLLAIATKLPVDLTTSMPSALDQLSKLSATILLCISMSFFLPSLGTQGDSEWISNMASLSILVVTVIVNVCIQMATGVIFSFIKEHVIIMFCMLLILIILWTSNLGYGLHSHSTLIRETVDPFKNSYWLRRSMGMMDKLKSVYRNSYCFNPELMLSGSPNSITVGMLSTLSTLVLLEATIRSLVPKEVKFHCGISDYKWSIWMVVMAQILTVLLGGIAIGFRWFTSVSHFNMDFFPIIICSTDEDIIKNYVQLSHVKKIHMLSIFKFSRLGFVNVFLNMVKKMVIVLQTVIDIIAQVTTFLSLKMRTYLACMVRNGEKREELDFEDWINEKSTKDINDRIQKYKRDSSTHLIQILANTCDHQELPISLPKEKVYSLLVVILIRMTKVLLPDSLSASLFNALGEAFEIICFVDEKRIDLNPSEVKMKSLLAKDVWMNKDNTNHWFNKKFIKRLVKRSIGIGGRSESQLDLSRALRIINTFDKDDAEEFCQELFFVEDELEIIRKLIIDRHAEQPYKSISDLYDHLKQLFVGMVNFYLSQLPLAIFRHVDESSSIEQCEERARLGIKFIWKVKPLVGKVNWSFPDGTGITSLIDDDDDDVLSSSHTTAHHIQPELVGDGEIQEHV